MTFRPLLAATIETPEDLDNLQYPLWGSPKLDGIRVLCHQEHGPVSRSMKMVRNDFIRDIIKSQMWHGMDGEVIVGDCKGDGVFARSTSGVMTKAGEPDFTYWVFDNFDYPGGYTQRMQYCETYIPSCFQGSPPRVKFLPHVHLVNKDEVVVYEQKCVEEGYEGIMLNRTNAMYKHGRSTLNQQTLLKMKRWYDDEATVVGFAALERNTNVPEKNALGLTERSDHKSGKVADSLLGYLRVNHPQWGEFSIGSGFDDALRREVWDNQAKYLGKKVTFKYMQVGVVEKPRFPIFKGFRGDE